MRVSTAQIFSQGVDAMLERQRELTQTELQLASGKRILHPADDPSAAARVLDLNEASQRLAQYQRNADMAQARLDQEESALFGIEDLLQRVRELAVQGNSDTLSAADRQSVAAEIWEHMDGFVQLANSRDANGEYIFGGYQSLTEPVSVVDINTGQFDYGVATGQRKLKIGDNREVAIGDPASIFKDFAAAAGGTTDLGNVIWSLATSLEAGNADPNALTDIDSALDQVLETHAKVGARMNAIADQQEANASVDLAVSDVRSTLEDLNYAEAVSRFNQQLTALQAAQQAFIKVQDLNLFNFLR